MIVQLVDSYGAWRWPLSHTDLGRNNEVVSVDAWRPLIFAHDAVMVLPSYLCALDGTPGIDSVSREIEYIASERGLPINGVYSTRPTRDCAADRAAWPALQLQPNTLYVVLPDANGVDRRLEGSGATCASFKYGHACSTNRAAIEQAIHVRALTGLSLASGPRAQLSPPSGHTERGH